MAIGLQLEGSIRDAVSTLKSQGCSLSRWHHQWRQGRVFHRIRRPRWEPALSCGAKLEPRRKRRGRVSACESL